MPDLTVRELFETEIPRLLEERAAAVAEGPARYEFVVRGREEGTWIVDTSATPPTVRRESGPSDCSIQVDAADLLDLMGGRLDAMQAFRLGKLVITGAAELALKLGWLFPDTATGFEEKPSHEGRSNFEYNRDLYDWYGRRWDGGAPEEPQEGYKIVSLGDEWSASGDVDAVVAACITPNLSLTSEAAEIGVGGGRVAARVAPLVRSLSCFDISTEMLRLARRELAAHSNVTFDLMTEPRFEPRLHGRFDFVYALDVFVVLDWDMIWRYLGEVHAILRPGGRAFVNLLDLRSPAGWEAFSLPNAPNRHHFITADAIETLATKAGFGLLPTAPLPADNHYARRDCLVLIEKRRAGGA